MRLFLGKVFAKLKQWLSLSEYDYFPLLPIACSELDFFMLSGVFVVLPLDPEWVD